MSEYSESEHYPSPADDERERLQRVWDEDAQRCESCHQMRSLDDTLIVDGGNTCRACLFAWLADILRGSEVASVNSCPPIELRGDIPAAEIMAEVKRAVVIIQAIVAFDPDAAFGAPVVWRNPRPE